jgi:hypothetical protein
MMDNKHSEDNKKELDITVTNAIIKMLSKQRATAFQKNT